MRIDLTPFGFTASENAAYLALLDGGPASGYVVAKRLSIARANAYQALNGLVSKGAATVTPTRPHRYRAVRPDAVMAQVVTETGRRIDELAQQVATSPSPVESTMVRVMGRRALVDLAMRTAAKEAGELICVGPPSLLVAIAPAWRRRGADGKRTSLWALASEEKVTPGVPLEGVVPPGHMIDLFGSTVLVLIGGDVAIVARVSEQDADGFWTSDPTLVGVTRAAASGLLSGHQHPSPAGGFMLPAPEPH